MLCSVYELVFNNSAAEIKGKIRYLTLELFNNLVILGFLFLCLVTHEKGKTEYEHYGNHNIKQIAPALRYYLRRIIVTVFFQY